MPLEGQATKSLPLNVRLRLKLKMAKRDRALAKPSCRHLAQENVSEDLRSPSPRLLLGGFRYWYDQTWQIWCLGNYCFDPRVLE